jgi:hypothetical protein
MKMGLDMYASTLMQAPKSDVDFDGNDAIELHYWRKHPNLHGWMESLYYEKGGTADSFNCVNLQLTARDLDRLETAIRGGTLPLTQGFFFGESTEANAMMICNSLQRHARRSRRP